MRFSFEVSFGTEVKIVLSEKHTHFNCLNAADKVSIEKPSKNSKPFETPGSVQWASDGNGVGPVIGLFWCILVILVMAWRAVQLERCQASPTSGNC